MYQAISRERLLYMENASVFIVSTYQRPVVKLSLHSSTGPEPIFATIEAIQSLEQIFKHVLHNDNVVDA